MRIMTLYTIMILLSYVSGERAIAEQVIAILHRPRETRAPREVLARTHTRV